MLERLLGSLYSQLVKLYPERFREDFGEEMGEVFAQALGGLDDSYSSPLKCSSHSGQTPSLAMTFGSKKRWKMMRLFFREVWYFPRAYLDARRYQEGLGAGERPANSTALGEESKTRAERGASWGEAFAGAIPFLLFGLASLLDGLAELSGHSHLAFSLPGGSLGWGAMHLTLTMGVYFACAVGLLFGTMKGFPRWSYAYLGMAYYFGWSYNNQNYYGLFYKWWAWLPLLAAIALGLLLAHSFKPLAGLVQGTWRDWTRLSFAIYAFTLPMLTVIFFDDDWGISQLYGLFFDTVLLAAGAVAFLRSRTTWSRVLTLQAVVLILVVKGTLGGWFDGNLRAPYWPGFLFIIIYFGFLLLPAVIGLLRRGVDAWSSR